MSLFAFIAGCRKWSQQPAFSFNSGEARFGHSAVVHNGYVCLFVCVCMSVCLCLCVCNYELEACMKTIFVTKRREVSYWKRKSL